MVWVVAGYAVSNLNQVLENRVLSLGVSGRLLAPMVLGAVANVIFSILLVRAEGVPGAARATFASFVVQALATSVFLIHTQRARTRGPIQGASVEIA